MTNKELFYQITMVLGVLVLAASTPLVMSYGVSSLFL